MWSIGSLRVGSTIFMQVPWVTSVSYFPNRVYFRALPCGTFTIWKKWCIKLTLPCQMGCLKKPQGLGIFFWNKVFENITDNSDGHSINLLWTFIASYCLNCLSLLRLSYYFCFAGGHVLFVNNSSGFIICS